MTQNEKALAVFQTRVRQMILRFQELKKELYAMVEKSEQDIKALQERLDQEKHEYEALKTARMLTITDGDLQGAKDRLAHLIREINKSIAILSGED